jgi:Fanconi anemia group J protein
MEQPAVKPVRLSGVDVCFPHEPYGVQKVFMAQVVRAVDHEENALLEAPTGCGKTLSLLCGALAWQTAAKEKKAAAEKAAAERAAAQQAAAEKAAKAAKHDPIEDTQDETGGAAINSPSSGSAGAAKAAAEEPPEEPIVVPKIYYATRTHSQIAQVCGVLLCGVVWCGVVWCGVVWCAPGRSGVHGSSVGVR